MSNIANKIWREFVYGGHMHSLGVAALVYAAALTNGRSPGWVLVFIIYLGIHSGYLYNRYREYEIDLATNPERTEHLKSYIKQAPYVVMFFLALIIYLLWGWGNAISVIFGIILFASGLLYSHFVKRFTSKILGVKNYFVSFSFAILLVLYVLFYSLSWSNSLTLMFLLILVRVFANTVFFDLKDVPSDRKEKLKTFPVALGSERSYLLIYVLNILSGVLILLGVVFHILPVNSLSLLLLVPYAIFYTDRSKRRGANLSYIASLYADGEYLLWPLLLIIGNALL